MHDRSLRILTTQGELASVRSDWEDLAQAAGSVLLDVDYVLAFLEAFGPGSVCVFVLERQGRVRAIAPLRVARRGGVNWLEFFDAPTQEVHAGFLHETADDAFALCEHLVRHGMPIKLVRIPRVSPVVEAFSRLRARRTCVCRTSHGAPTAEVRFPDGGPDKLTSADGAKKLRYLLRKAGEIGDVSFAFNTPGEGEAGVLFDQFVDVEAAGWKGQQRTSLSHDPVQRAFFRQVAGKAAARGQLMIGIMSIAGRPAAARLCSARYGALWDHKIGYDEQFAAISPGILLTAETLRWSAARGFDRHVFLGNHEKWQDRWRPDVHETVTLTIYPRAVAGMIGLLADAFSAGLRRAAAKRAPATTS